jgi:hypothetical protein
MKAINSNVINQYSRNNVNEKAMAYSASYQCNGAKHRWQRQLAAKYAMAAQ